jgi:hypothetical protein
MTSYQKNEFQSPETVKIDSGNFPDESEYK